MSNTLYTINAAALPKEVLGIIFASFDSAAQLGECRRVCKKWDNPAAKAMYSKKISVKSETCALKLYRHLFKDQSKIPLIRHMHFELDGDVLSFIFEELLRLALTPTVEKITGNVKADSFFKTIFDINAEPATSLQRLKTLPVYKGSSAHMNKTIIMWTKDSIRVLRLEMPLQRSSETWEVIGKLNQFSNLSVLYLFRTAITLNDIKDTLNGCPKITRLILENSGLQTPQDYDIVKG